MREIAFVSSRGIEDMYIGSAKANLSYLKSAKFLFYFHKYLNIRLLLAS